MQLRTNNLNINNKFNNTLLAKGQNLSPKNNSVSFTGLSSKGAKKLTDRLDFEKIKDSCTGFIKKLFKGDELVYSKRDAILDAAGKHFGGTFSECLDDVKNFKGTKNAIELLDGEKIKFNKDSILKNICLGIKDFTVGTILDICISARNGLRKLASKSGSEAVGEAGKKSNFFSKILDNRIAEKKARDAFYKVSGIFEKINSDGSNIEELAKESISSASKKVGRYNTKTERAWNRLGTGFVSALFASTDFYNISMLQNNDPEKAKKSGKKRFMQDMRRQGITAGITYVVLGALQKSVNNSILYAALSLGGVTLISEIVSRKMGKIPLKPLSPEEAKKIAEEKENKKQKEIAEKTNSTTENQPNTIANPTSQNQQNTTTNPFETKNIQNNTSNNFEVFNVFTDKVADYQKIQVPTFTSNNKPQETQNDKPNEKKKGGLVSKIGKFIAGGIGISLAIGLLRSHNILGIDDVMKEISKRYKNFVNKVTKKHLILSKDETSEFLQHLKDNGLGTQADKISETLGIGKTLKELTNEDGFVKKYLSKKASKVDSNGIYYDLGMVDEKVGKTIANVILYPINTISKLLKSGNNIVKSLFGIKAAKNKATGTTKDACVAFINNHLPNYRKAVQKGDLANYTESLKDAFTRHFSEANSQNKNTSVAMISRFLITLISGYFFVNDYRNEVLIESKGQDVEGANATMKERIGHKLSNFFLNSIFMDIFNTTFEPIYLKSVLGATGVAMATEFTNETAVRASICTPRKKMTKEELIEYEKKQLNGPFKNYYKWFMNLTGKKPLSEKAKPKDKK